MELSRWRALLPDALGLTALGLVVLGVWGLFGWQWALIAAGAPFAAFYVYGQAQIARRRQEPS